MSEKALKAFPKDLKHGLLFRDDHYIKLKENELKQKEQIKQNWLNENKIKDKGLNAKVPWSDDIAVSDWHELRMPDQLQYQNIDFQSGIFWMKKTVQLTSLQAKQNARLILGLMNDIDTTYINGIKVGSTNSPWKLRDYKIPLQALRFGNNTITVRMTTLRINAGMVQTEPYQLEIGSDIIPLTGKWLYKVGVKSKKLPRPRPSSWHPMGHFNAMISPLLPFSLKGVIWYQGETNTPDLNN